MRLVKWEERKMRTIMAVAAAAALAGTAAASVASDGIGSWRDFPGVANSSFVEPSGDRAIQLSIEVPATADEVFAAFTTSEGFRSWAAPVARVDLRVAGMIESSYDARARIGDPN